MQIPFWQIDAFASEAFQGNQACVMPLNEWLPDEILQKIGAENNVAETAFIIAEEPGAWQLRWFTPAVEVPLCGHATLAAAHAIFEHLGYKGETITFRTRQSGDLIITRSDEGGLQMDFPTSPIEQISPGPEWERALGVPIKSLWRGNMMAVELEDAAAVSSLTPDISTLNTMGSDAHFGAGIVGVFARGGPKGRDVISRLFAPGVGIDEDPATGAWHCVLAPVVSALGWGETQKCWQDYPGRGAAIGTELCGDRVIIAGQAKTVIEGKFHL